MNKFKILIYTDSRGKHVPKGNSHIIYGQQIKNDNRFDVTLCLCKMKWTTTLDFLEYYQQDKNDYDLIILHTGIVEHSPLHKNTAKNSIYENKPHGKCDYTNFQNKTGIINEKKEIFDSIFGERSMIYHLNTNLGVMYEGDETINMYSLKMLEEKLIPVLKKIPNLVWISSNKIVPGWTGDYMKQRPSNISLIEKYSELMVSKFPWVINLHQWSHQDVKKYTCDNIHLSKDGNDYIYKALMEIIEKKYKFRDTLVVMGNGPSMKKLNISDLRYFDCFALNMAHRIFDDIAFYPKYFGCFDFKVTDYHRGTFQKLINEMAIKRFFFIRDYFTGSKFTHVNLDRTKLDRTEKDKFVTDPSKIWDLGNSGSNACHVGIALGYKKLILVGVDCSYIDFLPEAEQQPDGSLKIVKTPTKNPNYWFDSYQRKGDIYNVPNASVFHQPGWELLAKICKKENIPVINCSEGTTLKCFDLARLQNIVNGSRIISNVRITMSYLKSLYKNKVATIIFNIKYDPNNVNFYSNFKYTITWFMKHYPVTIFEYILVEQDTHPKLNIYFPNVRKIFLYNPGNYNRGWGYNVAVKNYMTTNIGVLCDTDILLNNPDNLYQAIEITRETRKLVSPYKYVFFTSEQERNSIIRGENLNFEFQSKYPVTVSGGICVIPRIEFLNLGGYEEYNVYGGEDRSLDVLFDNNSEMINSYCIHLYHPRSKKKCLESDHMLEHLKNTYNCVYDPNLNPYQYIHTNCLHNNNLDKHILYKIKYFGNPDVYKQYAKLTINNFPSYF